MISSIVKFWKDSYVSSPITFYFEMISAITVMIGSFILTYTVLDPRPEIFIPFYFVGSVTGLIGAIGRKSAWVSVLTAWFTIMNTIALYQLFVL